MEIGTRQERNDTGAVGMRLSTYENRNLVIRDSVIQNYWMGIIAPRGRESAGTRETYNHRKLTAPQLHQHRRPTIVGRWWHGWF